MHCLFSPEFSRYVAALSEMVGLGFNSNKTSPSSANSPKRSPTTLKLCAEFLPDGCDQMVDDLIPWPDFPQLTAQYPQSIENSTSKLTVNWLVIISLFNDLLTRLGRKSSRLSSILLGARKKFKP